MFLVPCQKKLGLVGRFYFFFFFFLLVIAFGTAVHHPLIIHVCDLNQDVFVSTFQTSVGISCENSLHLLIKFTLKHKQKSIGNEYRNALKCVMILLPQNRSIKQV